MFLSYDDCRKYYPYTISDECGTFMDCDLEDLIELKNLIEDVLANEANYDTNQTKATKEKTKMEIKFMINWEDQEVASMEEFNNEYVLDLARAYVNHKSKLENFLTENYTVKEIFDMTSEQKKEVLNKFENKCVELAEAELLADGWEVCIMEI